MKRTDRYSYQVALSAEDQEYVATCAEFPSLSWLDKQPERALSGIREVVRECVEDMRESGEPIPEPLSTRLLAGIGGKSNTGLS